MEVVFFGMMGKLIDWLSVADKATFVSDNWVWLTVGGAVVRQHAD